MVQFQGGWRCPNCGHTEGIINSVNTVSPGSLVMPAGSAKAKAAESPVLPAPPPIMGAAPRPTAAADLHARPAVVNPVAPMRLASDLTSPVRPAAMPTSPPVPPTPTPTPLPHEAPRPAHLPRQAPRPMTDFMAVSPSRPPINPVPPVAVPPINPVPPLDASKPPMTGDVLDRAAVTLSSTPLTPPVPPVPPRRNSFFTILRVIIFLAVAAASAYSVYTFWQADPLGWFKAAKVTATPTPSASATPTPSSSATPVEAATPTPTPTPSSTADSRDSQRKSDLEAYMNAYAATRSNGYMPTQPQSVDVHRNDPTKSAEYQIITNGNPGDLGQIYYKAGGRCTAASITPGTSGTRYVALLMKLESQADLYCVDVP